MSFGSRIKSAFMSAASCGFKPSPTLDDDDAAPCRRHRMPPSSPDLQPRGPQPDEPSRRRFSGHWFGLKGSHRHARQADPPAKAPPHTPDPGSTHRGPASTPFSATPWATAPDRMDVAAMGAGQGSPSMSGMKLRHRQGDPGTSEARRQDAGPRFDRSRPSSLRAEVLPSLQEEASDLRNGSARQIWPQLLDDLRTHEGARSFDHRNHDSRDPTVHGPLNPSAWHNPTFQQWAGPEAAEPASPPETRRSLGAEVLRMGGLLAAHTARQAVATGTGTLVREAVNIGIAMGLRNHHGLAAGLTVSMTLLNLLAQLQREKRVLRAPDEAARGFHSLTEDQWQAATPQQQEALRQEQQSSSRRLTQLHLLSNLITSSIALAGAARPGGRIGAMAMPIPSALLGQMARQWVYVGVRDGLQATFTLVQPRRPSPLPNTDQQRMRTAGATFGGVQTLLGYAQEAVMPHVLGALSRGSDTIRASGGLLSSVGSGVRNWARTIAAVAGVRAALNTVGETVDDVQLTHHDAAQAGSEQVLQLDVRGLDPARRDYSRLLDHTMVRVFANDVVNGVMNGVGLAVGQLPAHLGSLASLIGNFGVGYLIHLTYPMVGNNFAAAGLVREAMRSPPPMDLEASTHAPSAVSQASRASSYYRPEA